MSHKLFVACITCPDGCDAEAFNANLTEALVQFEREVYANERVSTTSLNMRLSDSAFEVRLVPGVTVGDRKSVGGELVTAEGIQW